MYGSWTICFAIHHASQRLHCPTHHSSLLLFKAIYQCPNYCGLGGTSVHVARPLLYTEWDSPYHCVNNPSHKVIMYPSHGADYSSHRASATTMQKKVASCWDAVKVKGEHTITIRSKWNLCCRSNESRTTVRNLHAVAEDFLTDEVASGWGAGTGERQRD